jgi:Malectin domain/Fibronectin type III domain
MRELTRPASLAESKRSTLTASCVALLLFVTGTLLALNFAQPMAYAAPAGTAVTTYKNDNSRDGQYSSETILNQSNVNVTDFGKRVSYPVDGQVYAQPLYVPNLTINGSLHNVVFAATENDSVYAFDADATSAGAPLWHTSLLPSGATAVPNSAVSCGDMTPIIGITGTPVIDPSTNRMYVVSYDDEGGSLVYRLHALNILTGQDISPPVVLSGSAPGTGVGSSGGRVPFNPNTNRQRSALLFANGNVYIAFSSFCDVGAYHGWILSYSYNGSAFTQVNAMADTPNGSDGGIWSGDSATAADPSGNVYFSSGNGTFDANTGGPDYGDSEVKLNGSLQVQDYFTPYNQLCLSQGDADLGSGGPLLIPGANVLISAGKEGRPYVVNTTNMGKYTADPNLVCGGTDSGSTTIDKVQQELPPGTVGPLFSNPTYWNGGSAGQYVYFTANNGPTRAFSWNGTTLSTTPTSVTSANGGDAVVSSNGTTAGTGIVWNEDYGGTLHAYNATNLANELWNSNQDSSRDSIDGFVKFTTVVVTNGQVFVGTPAHLDVFGELSGGPPPPPPPPGGFQINSGGPAASPFTADSNFTGGSTSGTTHAIDTSAVTNPAPQAVYQSNRYGNFTYAFPGLTAGANYTVRLHFAEEYWTTAGSRIFNVVINGTQVLTNFDILGTAKAEYKAVIEQFTIPANSAGQINIQFVTVKDNAQVNGIEVLPTSGSSPPPTPTGLVATAGNGSVALTWTASTGATSYSIYRGTASGGEGATPVGTATSNSFTDTGLANGTTYYYTITASNSAGTSAHSSEVHATPTTTSPPPGVQINAGGPAALPFVADKDFTGGSTASVTHAITTTGVTNPAPQAVYQSNRYGNFTYTIPGLTAGSSYTVRLHFAEEYWTTTGSRIFNVLINGTQVLSSFDILATAGGEYKAVVEQFTATASSTGTITIQFVTVKDNAQVNGIEILPA